MVAITLPDGSVREFDGPVTGAAIAAAIGPGLAKDALAIKVGQDLKDLSITIETDAAVEIVTRGHGDAVALLRHDCAHVMAEAVQELYPDTQVTVGPATETGFFYDFARAEPFTTDDLEGERIEVEITQPPNDGEIRSVLHRFVGTIMQRPPDYSAVKIAGRRAYALSRRGETVRIAPRPVTIHGIDLIRYDWPRLELAVHCGRGTYIHSLARDIGTALRTGGHCLNLRRTAIGPFTEAMAQRLEDLPEPLAQEHLIPLDAALAMLDQECGTSGAGPQADSG